MARPSKLTPELQDTICELIAAGNYAETACQSAGVAPSTFYSWKKQGESEEAGPYADFFTAVQRAEAVAESHAVAVVQTGMVNDARLCMTFLERRFPRRWQRRVPVA